MKKILITLPLVVIAAGCNSSDANLPQGEKLVDAINSNAVSTKAVALDQYATDTDAKPTAKAGVTTVSGKPAKGTPTKSPAKSGTPASSGATGASDTHYKVVAEGNPGMPPEALAALKKLQVPPPPANMKVPDKARVVLTTSQGPITVELNGKEAPLHVKSFLYLSQRGFFNGTVFHRYEPDFVIQGGDPLSKIPALEESFGQGGPGYQIPREHNSLTHDQYVIAAARTSDPNSAGSQFYFTLKPTPFLDQGDGYTVFGKVVSGQASVMKLRKGDKITKVTVAK